MGRASRQVVPEVSSARCAPVPRAGLLRAGDVVNTPDGRATRVRSIWIGSEETSAIPWAGAARALLEVEDTDTVSFDGAQCTPRRFTPEREISSILADGGERTAEEIAEELGWNRHDVSGVIEDSLEEADYFQERFDEDTAESFYSLTEEGKEKLSETPPPREDRLGTPETVPLPTSGDLRVGDIVEGKWGTLRVESISLCDPDTKDGPDVPLVPWSAAGGRDFVVTLSNGHWAYAHQIRPRAGDIQKDVLLELQKGPLSWEELADRVGVAPRDLEDTLDELQFGQKAIQSEQVFTDDDEIMMYSLRD